MRVEIAALAALCAVFGGTAHAQRVEPMRYDLAPSGAESEETVRVTNNRDAPMTFEILVHRLDAGPDGTETLEPAEEDFLVFPPQAIVEAGAVQNIRVRYVGDPAITASEAYRIDIRQVPVDLSGSGEAGIGVAVSFLTLVNVVPEGAEPALAVTSAQPDTGGWRVDLRNEGRRYARLNEYDWELTSGGRSVTVTSDAVGETFGEPYNFIEPGRTLSVRLPAIEGLDGPDLAVALRAAGG